MHSIMERHQHSLLFSQMFENIAKGHGCSGGFCNISLEEQYQGLWTAFTPSHMNSRRLTSCLHTDSHWLAVIKWSTWYLHSNANCSWYHVCLILAITAFKLPEAQWKPRNAFDVIKTASKGFKPHPCFTFHPCTQRKKGCTVLFTLAIH